MAFPWKVPASLLMAGTLVPLAWYLKQHNPASPPHLLPPCVFHKITGLHCPGCGSTRSAHAILNADPAGAWGNNPAFVIALPFVIFGFFVLWLRWISPSSAVPVQKLLNQLPPKLPHLVLALFVVYGVLRNLPFAPFTHLAPH